MIYFANPCGEPAVVEAMLRLKLGYIATPNQGNVRPSGVFWCADNGCFGKSYVGDDAYLQWLKDQPERWLNDFAVAPDVVGDAKATLKRSEPWFETIRDLGYPVAFVAQDGLTPRTAPWNHFDALFIGGTTEWKLGAAAYAVAKEARRRGKWLHMGRVNSRQRYRYAVDIDCDSVDGTFLTFGPRTNLNRLNTWLHEVPFSEARIPSDVTGISLVS